MSSDWIQPNNWKHFEREQNCSRIPVANGKRKKKHVKIIHEIEKVRNVKWISENNCKPIVRTF